MLYSIYSLYLFFYMGVICKMDHSVGTTRLVM